MLGLGGRPPTVAEQTASLEADITTTAAASAVTPQERAAIEALGDLAAAELRAVPRIVMLTPLDKPDRAWCNTCQLPSLLAWQVGFELGTDIAIRTYSLCTDCGRESTE